MIAQPSKLIVHIYNAWRRKFAHDLPGMLVAALALALVSGSTHGLEREPIERIVETAEAFLKETLSRNAQRDTQFTIGRIDARLNLARCANRPDARLAPGGRLSGNTTINVRCNSPVSWSIFVPVSIQTYAEVVVAARPLSRGHIIHAGDVRMQRESLENLYHGYFTAVQDVDGLQVRRTLRPGEILNDSQLNKATLVRRGQQIVIRVNRPGFSVNMQGTALQNGREGERIRVRNTTSGRIVEGQVDASGEVHIR